MDSLKLELIQKALKTHKKIFPCGTKNSFSECFTFQGDKVLFWFDTEDHSTHMVMADAHSVFSP